MIRIFFVLTSQVRAPESFCLIIPEKFNHKLLRNNTDRDLRTQYDVIKAGCFDKQRQESCLLGVIDPSMDKARLAFNTRLDITLLTFT